MAGQRLTDKAAATILATDDLLMCVDVSDSTGSAEGTSKKIESKYVIRTDTIELTAGNFQALNSTPITLVAAPGSGHAILPLGCIVYVDYNSVGTGSKISVFVGHTGTAQYHWGDIGSFMNGITTDMAYCCSIGGITAIATIENLPLKIHSSANFLGVDFTAKVYITYQILKL